MRKLQPIRKVILPILVTVFLFIALCVAPGESNRWFLLNPIAYFVLCGVLYWVLKKQGLLGNDEFEEDNVVKFAFKYIRTILLLLVTLAVIVALSIVALTLLGLMN